MGLNNKMIEIITGDLLDAKEKYILHQTNCVSNSGAAGIAAAIFEKYPYADCYKDRLEPSKPGTIDIRGDGKENRFVINLHGQVYPGSCKFPFSNLDGLAAREKHFHRGLLRVAQIKDLESVALNWRVGCGIAGGNWSHFLFTITNFSNHVEETQNARVVIYRREGDD
jgi:O-acetyl-ADP-ribose deacetylase (regulator of RNase III)